MARSAPRVPAAAQDSTAANCEAIPTSAPASAPSYSPSGPAAVSSAIASAADGAAVSHAPPCSKAASSSGRLPPGPGAPPGPGSSSAGDPMSPPPFE